MFQDFDKDKMLISMGPVGPGGPMGPKSGDESYLKREMLRKL